MGEKRLLTKLSQTHSPRCAIEICPFIPAYDFYFIERSAIRWNFFILTDDSSILVYVPIPFLFLACLEKGSSFLRLILPTPLLPVLGAQTPWYSPHPLIHLSSNLIPSGFQTRCCFGLFLLTLLPLVIFISLSSTSQPNS